jgi:hypothetical protein
VERQHPAHTAPEEARELQAVVPQDPLGRSLASARAPGADAAARRAFVDGLASLDLGSPRATADRLHALLASGELGLLRGSHGASARAMAVERLLALGYPYALEVAPEDLAHWREERPSEASDGRGLALLVMTVAVCLSLWGVSEPPTGVGLASVLALEGVAVAGVVRPSLRRWARRTLFVLGIVACAIGARYGVGTLLPGIAAVVTARFIWPRGVRGVD